MKGHLMEGGVTRCDLHVHSAHSKRAAIWLMQKIGCPESFTDPAQVYGLARARGMNLVTITDHNTIDSCLEIAGKPGTFISEEITTYFPEDRCKIHVLAYDITETQHDEIQRVRENVFDLIPYLRDEGIRYACAHPLAAVNDRLTVQHFEQLLLMFKVFEINGDHDTYVNEALRRILASLTESDIHLLADKHKIHPTGDEPWRKRLLGGSDDHSSLTVARTFTEVVGECESADFLDAVFHGHGRVIGGDSNPRIMAHSVYGIIYQFYRKKLSFDVHANKDVLLRFLEKSLQIETQTRSEGLFDRFFRSWSQPRAGATAASGSVVDVLRHEATQMILKDEELRRIVEDATNELRTPVESWFRFTNEVSNKVLLHFCNHTFDRVLGARLFDVFHSLGSAVSLYALLAPYFVAFSIYSLERRFARKVEKHFARLHDAPPPPDATLKVAHFTDTFFEMNGVTRTLRQQLDIATRSGKDLTIFTCKYGPHKGQRGVRAFEAIGTYELPVYPDQKFFFPPFLEMLNTCYEEGYTRIHAATPGPLGLTALAIARILNIPIMTTYHTALPQYAGVLTEDPAMEELMWRYLVWYYNMCDTVFVCSRHNAEELIDRGVDRERIRIFPRGIDIERFHPGKRSHILQKRFGIAAEKTTFLYVGRISREKNLELLAGAFEELCAARSDVQLVVTGEGPYAEAMQKRVAHLPVTFTGRLEGEDLPAVYAASDCFVFPSTTDTFGNVVLEAQAAGCPVIVSDTGGPVENMLPGRTGLVARSNDKGALVAAMEQICADPVERQTMGRAAREMMNRRSFETAFDQLWGMYKEVGKPATAGQPGDFAGLESQIALSAMAAMPKAKTPATAPA